MKKSNITINGGINFNLNVSPNISLEMLNGLNLDMLNGMSMNMLNGLQVSNPMTKSPASAGNQLLDELEKKVIRLKEANQKLKQAKSDLRKSDFNNFVPSAEGLEAALRLRAMKKDLVGMLGTSRASDLEVILDDIGDSFKEIFESRIAGLDSSEKEACVTRRIEILRGDLREGELVIFNEMIDLARETLRKEMARIFDVNFIK